MQASHDAPAPDGEAIYRSWQVESGKTKMEHLNFKKNSMSSGLKKSSSNAFFNGRECDPSSLKPVKSSHYDLKYLDEQYSTEHQKNDSVGAPASWDSRDAQGYMSGLFGRVNGGDNVTLSGGIGRFCAPKAGVVGPDIMVARNLRTGRSSWEW